MAKALKLADVQAKKNAIVEEIERNKSIPELLDDIAISELSLKEEFMGLGFFSGSIIAYAIFLIFFDLAGYDADLFYEARIPPVFQLLLAMPVLMMARKSYKYHAALNECVKELLLNDKTKALDVSKAELIALQQDVLNVEEQYTSDQQKAIKAVLRDLKKQPQRIMPYWVTKAFPLFLISRSLLFSADTCFNIIDRSDGILIAEPLCGVEMKGVLRLIFFIVACYDWLVRNLVIAPAEGIPCVGAMPIWYLLFLSTSSRLLEWLSNKSDDYLNHFMLNAISAILNRYSLNGLELQRSVITANNKHSALALTSMALGHQVSKEKIVIKKTPSVVASILRARLFSPSQNQLEFFKAYQKNKGGFEGEFLKHLKVIDDLPVSYFSDLDFYHGTVELTIDFSLCTPKQKKSFIATISALIKEHKVAGVSTRQPEDACLYTYILTDKQFFDVIRTAYARIQKEIVGGSVHLRTHDYVSPKQSRPIKTMASNEGVVGEDPQESVQQQDPVDDSFKQPVISYDKNKDVYTFATPKYSEIRIRGEDFPPIIQTDQKSRKAWLGKIYHNFEWLPRKVNRGNGLQRVGLFERDPKGMKIQKAHNGPCCKLKYDKFGVIFKISASDGRQQKLQSVQEFKRH